jgi:hypothetical protein
MCRLKSLDEYLNSSKLKEISERKLLKSFLNFKLGDLTLIPSWWREKFPPPLVLPSSWEKSNKRIFDLHPFWSFTFFKWSQFHWIRKRMLMHAEHYVPRLFSVTEFPESHHVTETPQKVNTKQRSALKIERGEKSKIFVIKRKLKWKKTLNYFKSRTNHRTISDEWNSMCFNS